MPISLEEIEDYFLKLWGEVQRVENSEPHLCEMCIDEATIYEDCHFFCGDACLEEYLWRRYGTID